MHFLAGLGKKLLGDKAKKKIAGKAKGDLPTPKTPLLMIGGLLAGLGLFPIILILLMVAVICYVIFAPIEGAVNFVKGVANAVGDFFQSVGNFFVYGSFANDKTTYYNELKKHYDHWKGEGVILDVAWIASATNYARLADLNDSGECTPEVDVDGNVTQCGEETDYGQMTGEVKELVEGMVTSTDGRSLRKSDDEYKTWMLDESSGKSWIERHMEQVGADIPSNPEKKKDFLEDAVEQIFQMKEAYNEIAQMMKTSSTCGSYEEIKLCDTKSRGFTGGYANQPWVSGSYQHTFWNCDKGTCSANTTLPLGKNEYGTLEVDELGFTYMEIGGTKFYTAAVGSYYFDDPSEAIGTRYRITTDAGNVYHIILADVLADQHAKKGNNDSSPYCLTQANTFGDMYFDRVYMQTHSPETYNLFMSDGTNNHDFDENHKFSGTIVKIERMTGSSDCTGDFGFTGEVDDPIIEDSAVSKDYSLFSGNGNPFAVPQCTWFAWARFYQVYGYDSGARGNGEANAREIVAANPGKFQMSDSPAPGAVFSIPPYGGSGITVYGHVGFVEAFDGENIWISEGNVTLPGYGSGNMWFHKENWASYKARYPGIEFAVPVNAKKK